jgi:Domain of unknown function (DUF1905)
LEKLLRKYESGREGDMFLTGLDVRSNEAKKSAAANTGAIQFRTTILQAGKTATGIQIPDDVMAKLGTSKKPPVRITLNGYTYRSTVAGNLDKAIVALTKKTQCRIQAPPIVVKV